MSISKEILSKYLSEHFVETGSFLGHTVQKALDCGFGSITSIEASPHLFNICKERFVNNPKINLVLGDSSLVLWDSIKDIRTCITFWLDAHNPNFGPDCPSRTAFCPLQSEIEAISKHHIKKHMILIDDVRLMDEFGIRLEDLKNKILEINPNYIFFIEAGAVEKDILVAIVA